MIKKVDDPGSEGGGNSGWVAKVKEPKSIAGIVGAIFVIAFIVVWMSDYF